MNPGASVVHGQFPLWTHFPSAELIDTVATSGELLSELDDDTPDKATINFHVEEDAVRTIEDIWDREAEMFCS